MICFFLHYLKIVCVLKTGQTFMFDNVFDSSNQTEVFNALMMPLIDKAIEGFDCTFLGKICYV